VVILLLLLREREHHSFLDPSNPSSVPVAAEYYPGHVRHAPTPLSFSLLGA
jgi:hypothetical protein